MKYATAQRPGYCGDHSEVYSVHETLEAARKAEKKARFTDPSGIIRRPVCVIRVDGPEVFRGAILSSGRAAGHKIDCVTDDERE